MGCLTNKFSFSLGDAEWNGDTKRDASDPRRMLFVEKPGAVQYPNPLCKLHRPGTEGLLSLLILENPLRGVQRTKVLWSAGLFPFGSFRPQRDNLIFIYYQFVCILQVELETTRHSHVCRSPSRKIRRRGKDIVNPLDQLNYRSFVYSTRHDSSHVIIASSVNSNGRPSEFFAERRDFSID